MSTIEITRVEDVREGDVVTMAYNGHEFTGDAWMSQVGLLVGPVSVRRSDDSAWTFVRATRDLPDLPTKPGSVIVNATIRGIKGCTAMLDRDGEWFSPDYPIWHRPEDITAWTPARIVPEDGAS